ncbi:hemolysin [uncultured Fusobacterium sp.]|uniref:hemolysin n=1 Tax=uncultured Fusobacterium sp. TaxID=159267 RepID=UPI002639909C|nr:hemolysin [uncultured Fusobacterium sp.]
MNKLLNDALRAKGYVGPDIKMVLTDVKDPNGPFYTDTLTNVVVFDRKMLASANRDEILNALGHEFGHYSKEDNKTGTQTIANYSGDKLEDRTKAMVSKEATEDTLASIRNNLNVITGEEGKKLAESIPTERREYYTLEYFGTGGVASKKIASGGRVSLTESYYTSFDTENDRATKYTATTISVGAGDDDLSVAAGFGFYFSDSPEEIQKLSTSAGGSITLFGWSVGLDGLSKGNYDKDFLKKIKNIEGVRFYVGTGFIPLKKEFHISFLDYGKPISEAKYKSYNEYYKTRTLPSQIRNYYDNYYNGDKKNGQYKNTK